MSIFLRDIRRAIAQLIRNAEIFELAPEHVYTNRTRPLDVERMPAVCIFSMQETSTVAEESPRVNACEAEIAIAVYVKTVAHEDTDEDDKLDEYAQEIRNVMARNIEIDNQAETSFYVGDEYVIANEGEYAMGAIILRYKVRYREELPADIGGNLDNLRSIHTDWDGAPGPDGVIDAHDVVKYDTNHA